MFMTRVFYKIIRYPIQWRENRLKLKVQRKKKAIYSKVEKEKMKKLAALFKSNQTIQ